MNRTALYTKHVGIAIGIAGEFFIPGAEPDDVRQEARVALWEATGAYRKEVGPFPPFARTVIRRRLGDAVRNANRQSRCVLTDAYRDLDTVEAPADPLEHRERLREITRYVAALNERERETLARIVNEIPIADKTDDTRRYRLRKKIAG